MQRIEFFQYFQINWKEVFDQVDTLKTFFLFLTQKQIGNWTDQNRLGSYSHLLCFSEFLDNLGGEQFEFLIFGKLRNDVMIIRIKPFGHLHRSDVQSILLVATRHRKVQVQLISSFLEYHLMIALRDGTDHQRHV